MTFKKFEELFHTKYPNGEVVSHGKFAGTEKNMKTTVVFEPHGKCYSYYGAYEDVLCKIGMLVISKERFESLQRYLENAVERNGKEDFFGGIVDSTEDIERYSAMIDDIKANWIIA